MSGNRVTVESSSEVPLDQIIRTGLDHPQLIGPPSHSTKSATRGRNSAKTRNHNGSV